MKEKLEARKVELEKEFERVKAALVMGEKRISEIQGAYAEISKIISELPPPPDSEKSE